MPTIVVPFRGAEAKRRLSPLTEDVRAALGRAMLGDVVAAGLAIGDTHVVTDDAEAASMAEHLGATSAPDPGAGQGAAVAAALGRVRATPILVVNADLPCATARDLYTLLGLIPPRGLALVAARDGTTNALALASPALYAPLHGPGSAERYRARTLRLGAEAVAVDIPNLVDDVDTLDDLERVADRVGPRTAAALELIRFGAAR